MNGLKNNKLQLLSLLAAALILWLSPAVLANELFETYYLDNGIEVRLFRPETIMESMIGEDGEGRLMLNLPDGDRYLLVGDISDPVICNKGDGVFHPMKVEPVVQALSDIDLRGVKMSVVLEAYILPYPRYYLLASSTKDNKVFLSPGVYEIDQRVTAYIVTHEFGHIFHGNYLPDHDKEGWCRYLELRGIHGNPKYSRTSSHKDRPKEIFAEDFRFLFGGEHSRYSGTIENTDLILPQYVEGLEDFFVSLAAADIALDNEGSVPASREILSVSNFPNPFNPATTIHAVFGDDRDRYVDLRIYSVNGSLVRVLRQGMVAGIELTVGWDGTSDNGTPVATGVYLYRLLSGNDVATGKMFLVR